jgi:hypothetical protein
MNTNIIHKYDYKYNTYEYKYNMSI